MANSVRIHTQVTGNAGAELKGLKGGFEDFRASGVKGFLGMGAAAGLAAGGVGLAASALDSAATAVIGFGMASIDAARQEEAGIARLDAALKANIAGWNGNRDAIEGVIAAREKLAFSDDEQRASLAILVGATHDVSKALAIQSTAMDLARFKGISLAEASDALVRVEAGQYRMLKSLGIVLRDGATQTEALAAVQGVAAGQAEAFADSAEGAARSLEIAMGDLQEEIGGALLPGIEALTLWARDELVPAIRDATAFIKENEEAWASLGFALDVLATGPGQAVQDRLEALRQEAARPAAEKLSENILDLVDKTKAAHGATGGLTGALKKEGGAARDTERLLADLSDTTGDLLANTDDMRDAIRRAAKTLGEQKYGHQITKDEIRLQKLELKDNRGELEKLSAIKDPTRKQKEDFYRTRIEVREGEQQLLEYKGELQASGKVNMSVTESWIDRLRNSADEAGDEARELYKWLRMVQTVSGGGGGGGGSGRSFSTPGGKKIAAEGGWVGLNGPETIGVGERGPEYVIPNDELGPLGGGGTTINVYGVSVLTPGSAEALAQHIGPYVTKWQQQRRVFG